MDFVKPLGKKERDAWIENLRPLNFTHFVTLSFQPFQNFSNYIKVPWAAVDRCKAAGAWFLRMSHRVGKYGKELSELFLYHAFLEKTSRRGDAAFPHYHGIIRIPQGYENQFWKRFKSEWQKVLKKITGDYDCYYPGSIDVQPIEDFAKVVSYIVKFSNSEDDFISNLQLVQ